MRQMQQVRTEEPGGDCSSHHSNNVTAATSEQLPSDAPTPRQHRSSSSYGATDSSLSLLSELRLRRLEQVTHALRTLCARSALTALTCSAAASAAPLPCRRRGCHAPAVCGCCARFG
jgi:hypothetical protein